MVVEKAVEGAFLGMGPVGWGILVGSAALTTLGGILISKANENEQKKKF